jgi:hypothetical protein
VRQVGPHRAGRSNSPRIRGRPPTTALT